ncbi:hypothetical protein [Phaffia rhodozyma]|uniref:Uncharacterized protein n=1 Tax=Phaffia rhodozyma TaxID=264483 RepID=A0A0F7SUD7_PHARH|nr:hypothetical protein [Phaffia rhodozyma]
MYLIPLRGVCIRFSWIPLSSDTLHMLCSPCPIFAPFLSSSQLCVFRSSGRLLYLSCVRSDFLNSAQGATQRRPGLNRRRIGVCEDLCACSSETSNSIHPLSPLYPTRLLADNKEAGKYEDVMVHCFE